MSGGPQKKATLNEREKKVVQGCFELGVLEFLGLSGRFLMRRNFLTSAGALALLVCLGGTAHAQFNTKGFITNYGWNILAPLTQNGGCGGGGTGRMAGNWVFPHQIEIEDPKANTQWFNAKQGTATEKIDFLDGNDINAPGEAESSGWGAPALSADPAWITLDVLGKAFAPTPAPPLNDTTLNFQQVVDHVNANYIPLLGGANLPGDEVLGIATTYVRNTTAGFLAVDICSGSDDSSLIYVNNKLARNTSACRGVADCQELTRAFLPPGVSKIVGMVWEGGGGWDLRLGIRLAGASSNLADGNGVLEFLGPGAAGDKGQIQYLMERTIASNIDGCPEKAPVSVSLSGGGPGGDGDALVVKEDITFASNPGAIEITNISDGGVVTDLLPPPPPVPNPPVGVDFQTRTTVGNDAGGGSGTTYDVPAGEYTSVSTTGGDLWSGSNDFEFAYNRLEGDFDVSIIMTSRAHSVGDTAGDGGRWGKFGLIARQEVSGCSKHAIIQDHYPDLQDAFSFSGRIPNGACDPMYEERNDTGPVVSAHPPYYRLKRVGNVITGWGSDNPAVEADPTNDALWTRRGREDDWGPTAPSKLFVGFGNSEHNVDGANIQTIKFKVINLDGTTVPLVDPPAPIGKTITWNVTRAVLNAGLSYDVKLGVSGNLSLFGQAVDAAVAGGPSSITFDADQGPVGIFDNQHDIGTPPVIGSTTFDAGTGVYTQTSSGNDFWDGGDDGTFAYQMVTGDFVMTTRFVSSSISPAPGGRWGRYGLMARWHCTRDAKHSIIEQDGTNERDTPRHHFRVFDANPGNNRDGYYQVADGTFTSRPAGTPLINATIVPWAKLVRQGNAIYSYLADDAGGEPAEWCLVGSDSAPNMPDTLYVGVASHNHGSNGVNPLVTTFDNVSIEPLAPCAASDCTSTTTIAGTDFDDPDGPLPAPFVTVQGGTYAPGIVGGRLRLTDETITGIANAVWFPTDGGNLASIGFAVEFDAFMTEAEGGNPPADGMTFAIVQGNAALAAGLRGDGGGSLGYDGATIRERNECHPNFAVEMDNWVGGGEPGNEGIGSTGDPYKYHMGIDVNGVVSSIQTNKEFTGDDLLPDIFNPAGIHVEVFYQNTGRINVYVSGVDSPRRKVLSTCIPPLEGPDLLIGFTGATGGATCTQEIDNTAIKAICCEAEDDISISGSAEAGVGDTVDLTTTASGADGGGAPTYAWTIVSGDGSFVGPTNGSGVQLTSTVVGDVTVQVAYDDGVCGGGSSAQFTVAFEQNGGLQKPGDFNQDGLFNLSDPIATLNHLFSGGTAPPCGDNTVTDPANIALLDGNGDVAINLSDPIYDLNFLFSGGPKPVACSDITCPCILIVGCPSLGLGDCAP
jgi:legume-like lectin family protein